ncbi:response regulator transcription factor [Phenylobacterium sp. J426]|uniref:response regulator n=1 Tax=Phenylobacterium sp. J426 TaxID=2898439 RepID=UPI002151025F|nr:response regulator transcription factor [Phenylobacterium sp. J426]MCR5875081.1 response regulator transcription factor [Phenylobacterium sp. J426]
MSGLRLLIVDDEPQIVRALTPALQAAGYAVESSASGAEALSALAADPCEAIILDLGLPDMDGKEVIGRVREWSDAPIIVLSARDLETEKIAALDAGADDYVNKPVGVGELLARLRAAQRGRDRRFTSQARVRAGDLEIDFPLRRVSIQGEEVHLTPREYDLLRVLARHAGRVVTHRQLIAAVWGAGAQVDAQFVRVLVGQLRQKVEAEPASPRLVMTEPGLGYRLVAENEAEGGGRQL